MPFVLSGTTRIHYLVTGEGVPLLMVHGFANSAGVWQRLGYVEALRERFRLIMIDARGHGASDKPHDSAAYGLLPLVQDVLAVAAAEGTESFHYLGYSMGGWIGFGLAQYAPQRVRSLALGGSTNACERCSAFNQLDGRDAEAFATALEELMGERLSERARAGLMANDLVALTALMRHPADHASPADEAPPPLLLFAGDADARFPEVAEYARRHPSATLAVLPGLNHVTTVAHRDRVLPHLIAFWRGLGAWE